jgi:DNA-binding transcriptional LysR family regulator
MGIHKLRALEYLVAVVEHGGFAAAARQLGVSAPSVHRLVTALEAEIGAVLVHREGASVRPTREGARYVAKARDLLAELGQLDASLFDAAQTPQGEIKVACQSVVTQYVLAEALPDFHARYPQVKLDLQDAGTSRDLAALGADLLIQFGWPKPQDALVRTLLPTRWLIVASPSYWSRCGAPTHPSQLADHPCALFRVPSGEVTRSWVFVRGDNERCEVEVDGWLTGDDRHALDAPVLAGQMVGRFNDLTVRDHLAAGHLQPVLLDWQVQNSPPLILLLRRSLSRQPRVRAFVGFMEALARAAGAKRLPAGLPPVHASDPPEWFKRRVGV